MERNDSWAALYRRRVKLLLEGGMPEKLAARIAGGEERARQRLAGLIGSNAAKAAELFVFGVRDHDGGETVRFALALPRSSAPPNVTSPNFTGLGCSFVHRLG